MDKVDVTWRRSNENKVVLKLLSVLLSPPRLREAMIFPVCSQKELNSRKESQNTQYYVAEHQQIGMGR
jgi:hypothetical protein